MDKYPDLEELVRTSDVSGFAWTSPDGATITMKPDGTSISICYRYKPKKIVRHYKMLIAKGDTGLYLNKDER